MIENRLDSPRRRGPKTVLNNLIESFGFAAIDLAGLATGTSACGTDATDVVTTDPGRALVSGLIADAGLFKPPILRDLAVRAPFFHAGAAPDMHHLVTFYNLRFNFGLTAAQQADLVNFLNAL